MKLRYWGATTAGSCGNNRFFYPRCALFPYKCYVWLEQEPTTSAQRNGLVRTEHSFHASFVKKDERKDENH